MKVSQFNILNGAQDADRFSLFNKWMTNSNYDFIGLNEVNEWTRDSLEKKSREWGYEYSYLFEMESSIYSMALLSKTPIEIINTYEKEFQHGLVHAKIADIHVMLTHLVPFHSLQRENEAQFIKSIVMEIKEPLILMGDFNTLALSDEHYYEKVNLASQLKNHRLLKSELIKDKINYNPLNIILSAGLSDVGENEIFSRTIPTALGEELFNPIRRRVDYILINEMIHVHEGTYKVMAESNIEKISDHYPIECEIEI